MNPDAYFRARKPAATVFGTGLVALDVIMRRGSEGRARQRPGGTCGNVLGILAYLGWTSRPAARLGADPAAKLILREYTARGISTDLVERDREVDTPVIIHKITPAASGGAVHSFSNRCPTCRAFLPGYRPVLASSVEKIAKSMGEPAVFFFDRISRSSLLLAKECEARGALVVFEPSSIKDPLQFQEAVSVAHVLKYSADRLGDAGLPRCRGPLLVIETNGARGLRYRSSLPLAATKRWGTLPAFPVPVVRDAAGSGDWCTAGLIHLLGNRGLSGFLDTDLDELQDALKFGQALATLNCAHEGALGAIYDLRGADIASRVRAIMDGGLEDVEDEGADEHEPVTVSAFCQACM